MAIFTRPEMALHRDPLDQALIDALSQETVSTISHEAFEQRISSLDQFPLSANNLERLQDVVVANLDSLADEAIKTLELTDEEATQSLSTRLDVRVAEIFPSGRDFFLKRLSDDTLPRVDPTIVESILDTTREITKQGASLDQTSCNVVRRLMLLPTDSRECELPRNLSDPDWMDKVAAEQKAAAIK